MKRPSAQIALLLSLVVLAGCREKTAGATAETTDGGVAYTRLYMPDTKDVVIQIAWPSGWMHRPDVNQAVPYLGADLILAGGAQDFPAGEAGEVYADIGADGSLWATTEGLFGEIITPTEHLDQAVDIAAAHLANPSLDQAWLDRLKADFAASMTETTALPAAQGYDALRWAILGDTAIRRGLSVDPPDMIHKVTQDDIRAWQQETIRRNGAVVVVAGDIDQDRAAKAVDSLLSQLPDGTPQIVPATQADFSARRILLHLPQAQTSTLVFIGPLPPTRDGKEVEDLLLAHALGGSDQSALFDAVRTKLRASYAFGAGIAAYTRESRFLLLEGEVETAKLSEAETVVRAAYADFLAMPQLGDVTALKEPFVTMGTEVAQDPVKASFAGLMALLDGQDPADALQLDTKFSAATDLTIALRASDFPPADRMIVLAVSPDATAMPGACVITAPAQVTGCR